MKDYKRLTMHLGGGVTLNCKECELNENIRFCTDEECITVLKNRLAELEDKIENGTLIELHCKEGTTVYSIAECVDVTNNKVQIDYRIIPIPYSHDISRLWGELVFATLPEAEVKVRELKGERE